MAAIVSALWALALVLGVLGPLERGGVDVVRAHGFLTQPKVEFATSNEDPTAYVATIDGPAVLPPLNGMAYNQAPEVNAKAFAAAFNSSSYKTLREFVLKNQKLETSSAITPDCGRTKSDHGSPQPLPEKVVWQHGEGEGFTPSHEGPCEIWCDDTRAFHEDNCARTYSQVPAVLPYDRSSCEGKRRLQLLWLALHEARWQVYVNCVPLAGSMSALPATANVPSNTPTTTCAPPTTSTPNSTSPTAPDRTIAPAAPGTVRPDPHVSVNASLPDWYDEVPLDPATKTPSPTPKVAIPLPTVGVNGNLSSPTGGKETIQVRLKCTLDTMYPTTSTAYDGVTYRSLSADQQPCSTTTTGSRILSDGKVSQDIDPEILAEAAAAFDASEKQKDDRRAELKAELGYA